MQVVIQDTLDLLDTPEYIPGQAAVYSAILPGLGQIYNKRYWKLPIIYGLGATLGYFIYWNNNRFLLFRDSFLAKSNQNTDNDPFPNISLEAAQLNRDFFKRNRELLTILAIVTHALNIVDATVDAHLRSFDISDDLAFKIKPTYEQFQTQPMLGIKFQLILK